MIGDLCIQGEPNAAGEIEIGYGTYEAFQGRGLMTEMVGAIIEWAGTQEGIQSIVASTDKSNLASAKVLQKNDFLKIGETEASIQWKLPIRLHLPNR
jgi:RimJ/RimL family protein N-acetyltransferase